MGNGLIELGEDFVGTRVIFFRRREHFAVDAEPASHYTSTAYLEWWLRG